MNQIEGKVKLWRAMNREYLLIAAACAALAIAVVAEDIAAAIIVIFGSVIYWKSHKIEAKLNRLLARRRREASEASNLT
jgi:hypothetical protein